jgi:splicing factor U2AF subunit
VCIYVIFYVNLKFQIWITVRGSHSLVPLDLQKLMLQPGVVATKVVCLTQVVNPDELKDDDDYQDILEDMRDECGKFGKTLV